MSSGSKSLRSLCCVTLLGCIGSGCFVPLSSGVAPPLPIRAGSFGTRAPGPGEGLRGDPTPAGVKTGVPIGLRELRELARERNPSAAELRARVEAAEARLRMARAAFSPMLGAQGRFLRLEHAIESEIPIITGSGPGTETVTFHERESLALTTQLRYTVYNWGRNQFAYRASRHDLNAEDADRKRGMQEIDWAVARVYYGLLEGRRDLEVLEASTRTLTGALWTAEDLLSVGRATEADVLVVRANLQRRAFQLRQARDVVADLEEELARLIDVSPGATLELTEPLDTAGDPLPLEELETLALARRSEIRALDERHEALRRQRLALASEYLPEVFFFLQSDLNNGDSVLTENSLFSGGFGLTWSFFDGGRRYYGMAALEAEAVRVAARHREVSALIVRDVRRVRRNLLRSVEAIEVAETVVRHAAENLRRVQELFREGRATGQEVLEAESLLTSERARRSRARFGKGRVRERLRWTVGLDYNEDFEPVAADE